MVAASPGFLSRGAVNVISLDELKNQAGEQWGRIRDGVYARLESLLRSMLGPADFYAQINETAYLVTMPASAPEDVNLICLRAAFELHTSLLGECRLDQLVVGTAVPGGRNGELAVVPLPMERLNVLAHKADIHPLPPSESKTDTAASGSQTGRAATSPQQARTHLPRDLTVTHQFLPIWSVPNGAVTTYMCEPQSISPPNRRDSIPLHALEQNEQIAVEMSCFHHGLAHLQQALAENRQFILAVALSFDMLGSPAGREQVIGTLRNLTNDLRTYLAFGIHMIPHGVAQSKLGNLVNLLRPFGRSVSATVAPHSNLYRAYQDIGLKTIGFAMNEFQNTQPSQYEVEELSLFARRNKLGTFMFHVNNMNTLKYAQDARIQQLAGPAIAPVCGEPKGVWRLTWQRLMAEPVVEIWS